MLRIYTWKTRYGNGLRREHNTVRKYLIENGKKMQKKAQKGKRIDS